MNEQILNWLRRGHLTILLLVALGVVAALACGTGDDGPLASNQEFRLRIAADPGTLDPQLASVAEEISIVKQLFQGLFTYDENLNVVPAVALELPTKENGGISEDGLTYTINLRQNAKLSDGQPVTAYQFQYALQRLFDPEAGAQGRYFSFYTAIAGAEAAVSGEGPVDGVDVTALDDYTLQIKLDREQPTLTVLLALWPASPLRQDLLALYGDAWTEPNNFVGNGPFVLVEYRPGQRLVLEANTQYRGDVQPTLQRLVYTIIPEDSAALLAYQNGEIDMTDIPLADSARFADDPATVDTGNSPEADTIVDMGAYEYIAGDDDRDGDTDLFDYDMFADCVTGPGGGVSPECTFFDMDADGDVDHHDYAVLQIAFTGSP